MGNIVKTVCFGREPSITKDWEMGLDKLVL